MARPCFSCRSKVRSSLLVNQMSSLGFDGGFPFSLVRPCGSVAHASISGSASKSPVVLRAHPLSSYCQSSSLSCLKQIELCTSIHQYCHCWFGCVPRRFSAMNSHLYGVLRDECNSIGIELSCCCYDSCEEKGLPVPSKKFSGLMSR